MRKFKENLEYLQLLLENKDHLIDRLSLTDDQKEELKSFFKKYPNYESKIDWNRKDLTYEDFKSFLSNEGKSKSQAKKKGLEGITEGVDYRILDQKEDFIAYQPLTYRGSVTIASNRVPPVKENGAKWCTAYQKTSEYWDRYTEKGGRFCYVCTKDTKYALILYPSFEQECYSFEDKKVHCPENLKYLYNILVDQIKEEKEDFETKYLPSLYEEWKKTGEASVPEKYQKYVISITIPSSVISIGNNAFKDCENLKSITIPNSVTSIGKRAFTNCENLESIIIPGPVTNIRTEVFEDCKSLKSITIPNSVTVIDYGAFHKCRSLENIIIPDSVTSIGNYVFSECKSLKNIIIPDSVTSIGYGTFWNCESLESIIIPKSMTSIGPSAFAHCEKLTIYYQGTKEQWGKIEGSDNIERPVIFKKRNMMNKTLEHLNNYLLRFEESKDHLIDRLNLTDDQKNQLKAFFKKYSNYESKIDWNRKDLQWDDFEFLLSMDGKSKSQAKKQGLEGLIEGKDYKILEQTDDYIAYQPLTYLGSMIIASNRVPPVKGNGAQWCTAYQKTGDYWYKYTVRYKCSLCYICTADTKFALVLYPSLTKRSCFSFEDHQIPCPSKYRHLYQVMMNEDDRESYRKLADRKRQYAERRKEKENEQKELIKGLTETWKGKKTISLPRGITMLRLIKTVEVPEGAKSLAQCAFEACSQLRQATLPESLTSIGNWAFHNCHSLKDLVVPESVTTIGNYAFQNCWNLKSITLPKTLEFFGKNVFANCAKLQHVIIPDGVESIPYGCFSDCRALETVRIPKSVKRIERFAFWSSWSGSGPVDPVIYYEGTPEDWAKIEFMSEGPVTRSNEIIFEGK